MRILIAYWDLMVGGVQHMTTKLANAWVAEGHSVTIAVAKRHPGKELYPLDPRVELLDFGADRVRGYTLGLARLLRRRGREFDVLYSGTTVPNVAAVLARALARSRIKLVLSERDNPEAGFNALTSPVEKLIWRLKPWAYRRADALVCVSTPLADALARFTGIARDRIAVIHNPAAPDDASFLTAPAPHPWLAGEAVPVIVAGGRHHPQKDFPMLLRAFAELRRRRPVRLALLGDGEERPKIEALIDKLGLRADVLVPGMQRDIMPWLVHGDLFVMSSRFEGFGNVLVQALAAGSRIVSTDCPDGPAEVLEQGRYGTLTPVGDAAAMADAMDRSLDEPRDPERQRARAEQFSVRRIAARYVTLFRELP